MSYWKNCHFQYCSLNSFICRQFGWNTRRVVRFTQTHRKMLSFSIRIKSINNQFLLTVRTSFTWSSMSELMQTTKHLVVSPTAARFTNKHTSRLWEQLITTHTDVCCEAATSGGCSNYYSSGGGSQVTYIRALGGGLGGWLGGTSTGPESTDLHVHNKFYSITMNCG